MGFMLRVLVRRWKFLGMMSNDFFVLFVFVFCFVLNFKKNQMNLLLSV